jgi:6-phosphogluconolactonase (cycloisomerase 2 family)
MARADIHPSDYQWGENSTIYDLARRRGVLSALRDPTMIDRRTFGAFLAGTLAACRAWDQPKTGAAVFYASVGPVLTLYHIDVDGSELARQDSVTLPANVQYAWPHPSAHILYAAWSNGGPGVPGDKHGASALSIDPSTGALRPHGPSPVLRSRPLHISVDGSGAYALIAYNDPSGVTVHRINQDGTIGDEVKQKAAPDVGIFAHQIRVMPSGKAAVLVTRGNDPAAGKPEDPGALKIFGFEDGQLTNRASIAPGGGYGFGPRHLDFHPAQPWVYVSLERQNKLDVFKLHNDSLDLQPIFHKDTLAEPGHIRPRQLAGTVHVHPDGRYVYVANRSDATTDFQGKQVYLGGENTIAVFAVDAGTGEPTPIQTIDTRGFHPRTFALDPSGRMLVVANITPRLVRDGDQVRLQPATLATYRVGTDGKLTFARSYDVETGGTYQFWSGMVALQ